MIVLFDLDGTLLGARRSKSEVMDECARDLGISGIARAEYKEAFRKVLNNTRADTRLLVFEKVLGDSELAEKMSELYRKRSMENYSLYPEVKEVLENLSVRKGLVTNGPKLVQWEKIRNFGLEKYFDSIAISGEIGISKPSKGIFEYALRSLDDGDEKCFYVGDVPETDVVGARNSGVVPILIDRFDISEDLNPDYKISDLRELYEILK